MRTRVHYVARKRVGLFDPSRRGIDRAIEHLRRPSPARSQVDRSRKIGASSRKLHHLERSVMNPGALATGGRVSDRRGRRCVASHDRCGNQRQRHGWRDGELLLPPVKATWGDTHSAREGCERAAATLPFVEVQAGIFRRPVGVGIGRSRFAHSPSVTWRQDLLGYAHRQSRVRSTGRSPANRYLSRRVELGEPEAMMARALDDGWLVRQDTAAAMRLLRRTAALGSSLAKAEISGH